MTTSLQAIKLKERLSVMTDEQVAAELEGAAGLADKEREKTRSGRLILASILWREAAKRLERRTVEWLLPENVAGLRNLAERLMHVPSVHGVDQGDVEFLRGIARMIEEEPRRP